MLVAWALLLAAWAIGNAPFAAPDEADHYIRAVGIGEGQLIGTADPSARVGFTATQIAWTAQAARLVSLPRGFDPRALGCEPVDRRSTACSTLTAVHPGRRSPLTTALTTVGNYQPLPYLAPAVLLGVGSSARGALRLGRLAQALVVLALLAVAVLALRDVTSPLLSLLGPLLAVTPMALFCGASLGGSGIEIAAAIAFLGCLLRLCRPGGAVGTRWWICAALSGATLALTRAASPLWLALALLVVLAWSGRHGRVVARVRSRRAAYITAGVLAVAIALNRIWEAIYGSRVSIDANNLHAGLSAGIREWWTALPELIGKFGYLDIKLPLIVPLTWFVLVLLVATVAFAVSTPLERLVIALTFAGCLFGPPLFYALLIRPTGFGLQGRHVLPALVALPLLTGETLNRHRDRIHAARLHPLACAIPVAVATMQATAWYVNARRYAVGAAGPTWFPGHATWAPPGNWSPWLTATLLAGLCLCAVAFANPAAPIPAET